MHDDDIGGSCAIAVTGANRLEPFRLRGKAKLSRARPISVQRRMTRPDTIPDISSRAPGSRMISPRTMPPSRSRVPDRTVTSPAIIPAMSVSRSTTNGCAIIPEILSMIAQRAAPILYPDVDIPHQDRPPGASACALKDIRSVRKWPGGEQKRRRLHVVEPRPRYRGGQDREDDLIINSEPPVGGRPTATMTGF
ncbi:hypothetical protein [Sphingomonas sp. Leaf343]|uniref:hypothetical protein n=1 Tax=Sphingomonas sp. Leaf343 TaxID=1736345 RepID=UPI0014442079|nr:hypothetical protein [Sphingomonas sp. Leaf343]